MELILSLDGTKLISDFIGEVLQLVVVIYFVPELILKKSNFSGYQTRKSLDRFLISIFEKLYRKKLGGLLIPGEDMLASGDKGLQQVFRIQLIILITLILFSSFKIMLSIFLLKAIYFQ